MLQFFKSSKNKKLLRALSKSNDDSNKARIEFELAQFSVEDYKELLSISTSEDNVLLVVEKCCKEQRNELLPVIENKFNSLPRAAKCMVLDFLSSAPNDEYGIKATELLMRLLTYEYKQLYKFPVGSIAESKGKLEIVVGYIQRFMDNERIKGDLFILLLEGIKNGHLCSNMLSIYFPFIINELKNAVAEITNYKFIKKDDAYLERRTFTAILAELAIHIPSSFMYIEPLIGFYDKVLSAVTITAFLALNKDVPNDCLEATLQSNEARFVLYNLFKDYNLNCHFPEQYKTGFAYASALLAHTLCVKGELEFEPKEIHLLEAIEKDNEVYYIMSFEFNGGNVGAVSYAIDLNANEPFKFAEAKTLFLPIEGNPHIEIMDEILKAEQNV